MPDLTGWAFDLADTGALSPTIQNNTGLGAFHGVGGQERTDTFLTASSTVRVEANFVHMLNVDLGVALVEVFIQKGAAESLGVGSSVGEDRALVLVEWLWFVLTLAYLPGFCEIDWLGLDGSLWGGIVVGRVVVKCSTETVCDELELGGYLYGDLIVAIEENDDLIVEGDLDEPGGYSFEKDVVVVPWHFKVVFIVDLDDASLTDLNMSSTGTDVERL